MCTRMGSTRGNGMAADREGHSLAARVWNRISQIYVRAALAEELGYRH
jgi:hypothetical protein